VDTLQPYLFQKARRQLPLTVKSDSGLAEGELWFIEGREITFWSVERLEVASRYEMRADVKTLGRNVDLMVEVVEVMHGRDAGRSGGFLHRGEFMALDAADEKRLALRFWQLNPEHTPPDVDLDELGNPAQRAGSAPAQQPAPSRSREGSTPRRDRASASRSSSSARSHGARSLGARETPRRKPTPGERRRMREHSRASGGIPDPPLVRECRVAADVAPGDPPTAMMQYSHREIMQADVLLRGEDVWLFVGCHPLLWKGQEVSLYVQLPAGHVVQLRGRVVAMRKEHCVIESRRLHAAVRVNLENALGV